MALARSPIGKDAHMLEYQMGIRWIVLHGARPLFRRLFPDPGTFRGRRELLQRLHIRARQPGALPVQPAFELRGIVHMEAIEQRTAVDTHRVGRSARAQRLRERTERRNRRR